MTFSWLWITTEYGRKVMCLGLMGTNKNLKDKLATLKV